ncbi:hypothetical protein AVEN_32846-1 [Araneus ventricosus]|uniref:Uncharacterized protein n=1 Tax=Araneus ventricosus TaxID=182803 RepID=A0A4Y2E0L2_ARAVE|nr:hypothetical protein AVEN_32846-1 [Araneus ventricosus]
MTLTTLPSWSPGHLFFKLSSLFSSWDIGLALSSFVLVALCLFLSSTTGLAQSEGLATKIRIDQFFGSSLRHFTPSSVNAREASSKMTDPITASNFNCAVGTMCHVKQYSSSSTTKSCLKDPFMETCDPPITDNTILFCASFERSIIQSILIVFRNDLNSPEIQKKS